MSENVFVGADSFRRLLLGAAGGYELQGHHEAAETVLHVIDALDELTTGGKGRSQADEDQEAMAAAETVRLYCEKRRKTGCCGESCIFDKGNKGALCPLYGSRWAGIDSEEKKMAERRIVDIGPLLEDLKKELEDLEGSTEALTVEEAAEDEIGELEALPVIDPASLRPTAKWIIARRMADGAECKCGNCGRRETFTTFDRHTDHVYCCRCGYRMEGFYND